MPRPSQVIVVLSPKGGTGKTTVSTNLAVGLARRRPDEVLLVDLDLAFGDVAAALLVNSRDGLVEVAEGAPPRVHPSGLHVVGAPDTPMPVDGDAGVAEALDAVIARYPVVVVDTGAGFDRVTRAAAERATDIVLVASMDVPTLLGLRKVLLWLDALGLTSPQRHLVLNRANANVGLDAEDVDGTLQMPVAVSIPSDVAVTRSVNDGRPITEGDGDGPADIAFAALVDRFAGPVADWRPPRRRRPRRPASTGKVAPAE